MTSSTPAVHYAIGGTDGRGHYAGQPLRHPTPQVAREFNCPGETHLQNILETAHPAHQRRRVRVRVTDQQIIFRSRHPAGKLLEQQCREKSPVVRMNNKVYQQSRMGFAALEPELPRPDADKSNRFATLSMLEEKNIAGSSGIEQIEPIVALAAVAECRAEFMAALLPGIQNAIPVATDIALNNRVRVSERRSCVSDRRF